MAEYIEREATLHRMKVEIRPPFAVVRDMPAADVVEVRNGEWIKNQSTADVCAEYRCSLCGFMYCEADPKYPPYKYCPECGANNE